LQARQRVYFFLGFPVENTVTLHTDKSKKRAMEFRQRYNIDFTVDGTLSQPWNVSTYLPRPHDSSLGSSLDWCC
jgi:hypothetical protein